jgi:Glyoxalase/Bleomycin resistance protein/Dioxygenase superfamily
MTTPEQPTRKIQLVRIAHIYYTHTDLEKANKFLLDFGFVETEHRDDRIFYKGYGTEPFIYCAIQGDSNSFTGAAFVVESLSELEYAAETLPDATPVHDLDAPGGGKRVTFKDPVDGYPFHLVYGQRLVEHGKDLPELDYNYPTHKPRGVNKTQRFSKGPSPIHKLGHFGTCVTDFAASYSFYTSRFNIKASELVYDDSGTDITTFLHLDRGKESVDHHCFFFFQGPKFHVHHSSYEVHDFDIQSLGHQWLRDKGYELVWGVGRHVMGSQIFDYWWDTSGFMMEHYGEWCCADAPDAWDGAC